jgi:hypothetical protein
MKVYSMLEPAQLSPLIIEARMRVDLVVGLPQHAPAGTPFLPCAGHRDSDENTGLVGQALSSCANAKLFGFTTESVKRLSLPVRTASAHESGMLHIAPANQQTQRIAFCCVDKIKMLKYWRLAKFQTAWVHQQRLPYQ